MTGQPLSDRFQYKTADALRRKAEALGVDLPFENDLRILLEPADVGGQRVPNRLAAQPMEGCDGTPDGAPGDLTTRRYERIASGGSGLIWFEATSVAPDGRANPRQLFLSADTAPAFRRLVDLTRAAARRRFGDRHEPYLVVQLTHSGRFSRTAGEGRREATCFNPHFDRPVAGMAPPPEHPLVGVARLLGLGAAVQSEVPAVPAVATGLSWLRQFWPPVAAGLLTRGMAVFAGLGRGAFAYPDAAADLMARGVLDRTKCCIACSRCTELMRIGSTAGCAVRDHPLYSSLHRAAMASARSVP